VGHGLAAASTNLEKHDRSSVTLLPPGRCKTVVISQVHPISPGMIASIRNYLLLLAGPGHVCADFYDKSSPSRIGRESAFGRNVLGVESDLPSRVP
jgi:hypothetical protein